jgi:hypothetical protein
VEEVPPGGFFSFFRSAAATSINWEKEKNMYQPIQFKTTIPHSVSRLLLRRGLLLIPLVFICLGLSPALQAVNPPPVGGYPGFNTATGDFALFSNDNTQGQFNTAIGFNALRSNTTGDHNTAFGLNTLLFNTTGFQNMGVGGGCLRNNTNGNNNTAVGYQAMSANTTGDENVAIGFHALNANTTGIRHVAIGFEALASNTTGSNASNAVGYQALQDNTTGNFNNAFGWRALANNTTGSGNIAMGDGAGDTTTTGGGNVSLGQNSDAGTTGSNNIAIGNNAGGATTGSNNIAIGASVTGTGTVSNNIEIGLNGDNVANNRTFIGNIRGVNVGQANGITVIIDSDGQLGTANSSRRFKNEIKPLDQTSEAILALKPVTYHYNDMDSEKAKQTPQYGLIAEDVAEVNPNLVVLDDGGQPLTVRYEAVNVMLLNEFLKEHRKVQELEKGMQALAAQLKEQASQIQKVSAQLELNQRAPRTVANK